MCKKQYESNFVCSTNFCTSEKMTVWKPRVIFAADLFVPAAEWPTLYGREISVGRPNAQPYE